jgi:hypothetical protein
MRLKYHQISSYQSLTFYTNHRWIHHARPTLLLEAPGATSWIKVSLGTNATHQESLHLIAHPFSHLYLIMSYFLLHALWQAFTERLRLESFLAL